MLKRKFSVKTYHTKIYHAKIIVKVCKDERRILSRNSPLAAGNKHPFRVARVLRRSTSTLRSSRKGPEQFRARNRYRLKGLELLGFGFKLDGSGLRAQAFLGKASVNGVD